MSSRRLAEFVVEGVERVDVGAAFVEFRVERQAKDPVVAPVEGLLGELAKTVASLARCAPVGKRGSFRPWWRQRSARRANLKLVASRPSSLVFQDRFGLETGRQRHFGSRVRRGDQQDATTKKGRIKRRSFIARAP